MKDKKIITILTIFTIIFTFFGSTLAYWNWTTNEAEKTNVTFTVKRNYSCAADGGGNISSTDNLLAPADCLNTTYAIKRTVTVTPTINSSGLSISMDLWLNIEDIGEGLSESENFRYALTESASSCTTNPLVSGTFNGKTDGDKVYLLKNQIYTSSSPKTYYLYIWLDKEEISTATMNQTFTLTLGGTCSDISTPEKPVLDDGMIPVTISDTGTVTTISENDSNWYDYENKKWANVVLVNQNATTGVSDSKSRDYYLNNDGVTVSKNDILAYYVWIPRYRYYIPVSSSCSNITNPNYEEHSSCYGFTTEAKAILVSTWLDLVQSEFGLADYTEALATKDIENGITTGMVTVNINGTETPYVTIQELQLILKMQLGIELETEFKPENELIEQSIDITFESGTEAMTNLGLERTHPAFWWDHNNNSTMDVGETLSGIWVGKFEPSLTNDNVTILPDVAPLVSQNVSTQFASSQTLSASNNIYGLSNSSTNAHMLKNSEWGAVAYLSHSQYGIDREIRINNYYDSDNDIYKTGCGASTPDAEAVAECQIAYGTPSSETFTYPQSTTGNISGIFDINGGTFEYVMGNYGNTLGSSGFTEMPAKKYYDLYSSSQFTGDYTTNINLCTLDTCGGHALNETKGWHGDFSHFVDSDGPWFGRGGDAEGGSIDGAFAAVFVDGSAGSNFSWRSALVVGFGA